MENLQELDESVKSEAIILLSELQQIEAQFPTLVAENNEVVQRLKLAEIQKSLLRFANLQLQDALQEFD